MSPVRDRLRAFADRRLRSLIATPEIWGATESVELQVLQLLQVRALVTLPEQDERDPGATREHYVSFLRAHFPDAPPIPLAQHLAGESSLDRFSETLRKFVQEECARQDARSHESELPVMKISSASERVQFLGAPERSPYRRSTVVRPFFDT
jgi:hypothetical protein